ncbi:hypothetical protein [Paraburkholderia megapolitana]|uniref:Secreted protein n=1 Tax=Paraburkholderia megapolitana TaxID=420953 RepID=A0A1I3VBT5_9BURK|nr:hypothetical protein [Paraburkholderia megapolitana]SFJ91836.1 hypothetical protein SAMN05192543_11380 [Paraburkholderia megapolitana]
MKRALLASVAALAVSTLSIAVNAQGPTSPPGRTAGDARLRTAALPFAFRGIPLGVSLDVLRANRTVRATPPDSELVCETDVSAGALGMRLKSDDSLVVACRWAHRAGNGWQMSRAVVDGAPADEHVLRFARASYDAPLRLFEISFVVDGVTAEDLRSALAVRYGAPRMQTGSTSSGLPGLPGLPVYVWENAVSSITLCLLPATGNGTLTYLLKDPDARVRSVERLLQAGLPETG